MTILTYGAVGGVVSVAVGIYLLRRWGSSQWGYFQSNKNLKGQVTSSQWGYFQSNKNLKGQETNSHEASCPLKEQ